MTPLRGAEAPRRPAGRDKSERTTVSTACPNCGAPLDFDEGIHAVECHHCKTHLLITGRKRLKTYWVPPPVNAAAASRAAQQVPGFAGHPDSQLIFVPYYRFTAQDFFWCKPGTVMLPGATEPTGWKALFAEQARDAVEQAIPVPAAKATSSDAATGFVHVTEGLDLKIYLVDRTFIASVIERPALFSLGIRGSALKLRLLQSTEIKERGTTVAVSVPSEAALRFGLKTYGGAVAMRATVCQSLSLIYFPYYLVQSDGRAVIIDGVTGGVIDRDVPRSVARELLAGGEVAPATIELRALTCPNCGWDFPVRPLDVAFLCASCDRAWQLIGSELQPIEAAVADVRLPEGQAVLYLPFWVLAKQKQGQVRQFFVAGFQYKNLRQLHQLASNLTGRQPQYTIGGPRRGDMMGCFYDEEDACRFSRFLEVRKPIASGVQQAEEPVQRAVLTWIPFSVRGSYLVDPFLGFTNLTQNMLA